MVHAKNRKKQKTKNKKRKKETVLKQSVAVYAAFYFSNIFTVGYRCFSFTNWQFAAAGSLPRCMFRKATMASCWVYASNSQYDPAVSSLVMSQQPSAVCSLVKSR